MIPNPPTEGSSQTYSPLCLMPGKIKDAYWAKISWKLRQRTNLRIPNTGGMWQFPTAGRQAGAQILTDWRWRNSPHHEVPDGSDVHGDWLLCVLSVWLDPSVFHSPHWVLDVLRGGEHRPDHLQLLLQPVERLHLRYHRGVWLQGLPFHVGLAG